MKTYKHARRGTLVLLVGAALALSLAQPGTAHGGNVGTIKVHDGPDAEPDERNEPHVDCDFWIEGFNMDGSGGELVFYGWPPTGDKSEVMRANWTGEAEAEGSGFHFLAGPFELPSGHYRVEAFSDEGHPGDHGHFAKTKTFWVECEVEPPTEEPPTEEPPTEEPPAEEPAMCPPVTLSATAHGDTSITVTADGLNGSAELLRSDGGAFVMVAELDAGNDTYVDTDTEVGVTYTYQLAIDGEVCAVVEVTAIPVFPGVAAALATGLGVLGYVGLRRRR